MIESDAGREEEGGGNEAPSSDGESSDASFGPAPLEASSPRGGAAQEGEDEGNATGEEGEVTNEKGDATAEKGDLTAEKGDLTADADADADAEADAAPQPRSSRRFPGDRPTRGAKKKRPNDDIYLKNLPTNKNYQVSYMHTDVVTHVLVSNKKKYIVTGSANGVVKFWYKNVGAIEFVKHFKIHSSEIICLFLSEDEEVMGSLSKDKTYKQFDVSSFDLNIIIKLDFCPQAGEYVYSSHFSPTVKVAISSSEKACIYIYKPLESDVCTQVIDFPSNVIQIIKYNREYDLCVLSDNSGLIDIVDVESFHFPKGGRSHTGSGTHQTKGSPTRDSQSGEEVPPTVRKRHHLGKKQLSFSFKSETDLYELCKYKTYALCVSISPDGEFMAILSETYFLYIYKFGTMKMYRVYDESTEMYLTAQNDPLKKELHIDSLDFGKRLFIEKEIKKHIKSKNIKLNMITFDESNQYIIYSTFIGIKVVNFVTNQLCYIIGKNEMNLRYLSLGLYQKIISANKTRANIHESLYINEENISDCALFCTVYKKARFYVFTKKAISEQELDDRDVYNEQPSKNDLNSFLSSPIKKVEQSNKEYRSAIIYTTLGEIHIALFHKECKRTVENFAIHSTNGYYNNCIFHRVIKNFMIQTGDPLGDGTGGESIWGKEFEDEFFDHLNHSKPFMVSMANCGPNTNGSQFFITTVPCPWLDFKHTVFGKVTQGTKVVLDIEKVRTDKRDKPLDDIKILNIKMCH